MARKAYVYIEGMLTASYSLRELTKGYVGINNVARKIRKAYIGIGGAARPCWGGILNYYGKITDLSVVRDRFAATTVGDYALFGGGASGGQTADYEFYGTVDAYNSSLTRTTAEALTEAKCYFAATTVGDYALFGGGYNPHSSTDANANYLRSVDAYNSSLTRKTLQVFYTPRAHVAATTVGNYALFAGGHYKNEGKKTPAQLSEVYDSSLTRSMRSGLSVCRRYLAATSVGNYALFGGGNGIFSYDPKYCDTVDAFDSSLTRTKPDVLLDARSYLAATTVGSYALFAGGKNSGGSSAIVDAYDSSLTRTTPNKLSFARHLLSATTVGDFALFEGGYKNSAKKIVDAYDSSLTRTTPDGLLDARCYSAATTVGNYALFAGGNKGNGNALATVEAYTI
jgi:hypothetical protein